MADKQYALAIILKAIDKASPAIKVVADKLEHMGKEHKHKEHEIESDPLEAVSKKLEMIGKATGLTAMLEVARTVKEIFATMGEAVAKVVEGVMSLTEHFAALNDTAERIGVSVDFLAGLRYGASKTGASVEKLDQGLTTFVENLGGLKAGTGKLTKFLGGVAPTMLTQLKATQTTEEALGILAEGMGKLTNKAKQLKFAQEALGDPALAALFHRGPEGINELMAAYAKLAGPQQEAAEAAAKVDDTLKDLRAAGMGVQAALMRGVAPALLKIIPLMTEWLSGHREQITEWLEDFGAKLPDAVDKIVDALKGAVKWVGEIVDDMGGWDVVANTLKDLLKGGLMAAMVTVRTVAIEVSLAVKALMLAFDVSPIKAVIDWLSKLGDFLDSIGVKTRDLLNLFLKISNLIPGFELPKDTIDAIDHVRTEALPQPVFPDHAFKGAYPLESSPRSAIDAARLAQPQQAQIKVDFVGAPRGTRVTAAPGNTADVDLTVGYQLGGAM